MKQVLSMDDITLWLLCNFEVIMTSSERKSFDFHLFFWQILEIQLHNRLWATWDPAPPPPVGN